LGKDERWTGFSFVVVVVICGIAVAAVAAASAGGQNFGDGRKVGAGREIPPYWAYAVNPPVGKSDGKAEAVDNSAKHLPGSEAAFTVAQTHDFFNVPDWHPDGHPVMPEIVARGRKPDVFACGYCHLSNGQGRPENSSLAGLPVVYVVQQMSDFKNGLRKSSVPEHLPVANMIKYETLANEQEIAQAAAYFSGIKPKPWIKVVETESVPKTHIAGWMLVVSEPREMEPIGARIIETPENLERTELRDDASGFIAYVPVGSVAKGKALATTGGDEKTVACGKCHGADLKGLANVPGIAGRSPSYVVRQLFDMQDGARAGAAEQFMKPVVAKLNVEDMISLAAYTASLNP
jgi:cytochrome c553